MTQDEVREALIFLVQKAPEERKKIAAHIVFDHSSCGPLEDHGYILPEMIARENQNSLSRRALRVVEGMERTENRLRTLLQLDSIQPRDFDGNLSQTVVQALKEFGNIEMSKKMATWFE